MVLYAIYSLYLKMRFFGTNEPRHMQFFRAATCREQINRLPLMRAKLEHFES